MVAIVITTTTANIDLFFCRGNPSYFRFTMQEIGLCAQIIGHKDAVRLEEKSEEQVRCGVFLDPTELSISWPREDKSLYALRMS